MHKGFVIRNLTEEEIGHKVLFIPSKDREIFPRPNIIFFIDSYDETYGAYLNEDGLLLGVETWFDKYPHMERDSVIISKTSTGFSLSSTSELVQQQVEERFEKARIDKTDEKSETCPNCQFTLECVGVKDERYIIKCARCGFTLVRKILDS